MKTNPDDPELKVYIGTCGVGLGHVTRSEAIAQELSRAGCDVQFSSYLDGLEYLDRTRWKYVESPPISFQTREDGTIDTKLTATQNGVTVGLWKFVKQLINEIRGMIQYSPDVVVSDTRLSTLLAGFILRRPTLLVINQYRVQMPPHAGKTSIIDRFMLGYARIAWKYASAVLDLVWGLSNIIAVPDFDNPLTISTYNLLIPKRVSRKVRLVGPLSTVEYAKRSSDNKVYRDKPLVFASISGPSNDRQHLVELISDLLEPLSANIEVVMSCGDPRGSSLPKRGRGMTIYEWMEREDYERTLRQADIMISRAGHSTIMMGISEGKPLILIPPPSHTEQTNNARRAEELGLALVLDQSNLTSDKLARAIRKMLDYGNPPPTVLQAASTAQNGARAIAFLVRSLGRHISDSRSEASARSPSILAR